MTDCQFYLTLPDVADADFSWLAGLLAGRDVAALRLATTDTARAEALLHTLRADIQGQDIALMLTDLVALARAQGCDGCAVSFETMPTQAARKVAGEQLQIGVPCGTSRDRAMQAGEDGADYVAFSGEAAEVAALVGWWVGIAELPVVAEIARPEDAAAMRAAGADFIACDLPATPDAAREWLDKLAVALATPG